MHDLHKLKITVFPLQYVCTPYTKKKFYFFHIIFGLGLTRQSVDEQMRCSANKCSHSTAPLIILSASARNHANVIISNVWSSRFMRRDVLVTLPSTAVMCAE